MSSSAAAHPPYVDEENLPSLEPPPDDEAESSHLAAYELSDVSLSRNISYYSSLEARCRQVEGEWRKTEAKVTQQVAHKESEKYLHYFDQPNPHNPEKHKTVKYIEAQVSTDEEVGKLRRRLAECKGQVQEWRLSAEAYSIKKMDYLSERKHRRESSVYDPEHMSERIPG
jgi:hypothetical protein